MSALSLAGPAQAAEPCLVVARLAGIDLAHALAEGKVRLATAEGEIAGTTAVLRFLGALCPAAMLEGNSEREAAEVDQWLEFAANEACHFDGTSTAAMAQRSAVLATLDARLSRRTFLASQRVSLADVATASLVATVPEAERACYPSLNRWANTCWHQFANSANGSNGRKPALKAAAVAKSNSKDAKAPVLEVVTEPENAAIAKLAELQIAATTYAHPVAMTVEEQTREIGHLPGLKTKNLFLKDKKSGKVFLVTVRHDRPTDTKELARLLQLGGNANLRFADADLLQSTLGVTQGSVGPLALVNNVEGTAAFALDAALVANGDEIVNSHPLRNDRTTAIKAADLMAYVRACGGEPILLDLGSATTLNGSAASPAATTVAKAAAGADGKPAAARAKPAKAAKAAAPAADGDGKRKETMLGIDKRKEEDFAGWYQQVITYSEMIDYYDISGCYILRPWAFEVWEHIQSWFDARIKEHGVRNAYFPLFVSKKALEAEKDHVEGFAPEVAWVTKSGETDLVEPIAVRPTSETIMYPAYARWIRSHRDLPLLLNQWSNVVRWEFKDPTPFLRSREFLWQEGHTAHATFEEAQAMVLTILDLYRRVYEELLAVPVVQGRKTDHEKFAGGDMTFTVEAYIGGSGRAIQGATSHNLGQNFGKMFKISFEDTNHVTRVPWQTSWGITTRSIGVCVMCHGDDKGLVLPPRIAPLQAVLVPIYSKVATAEAVNPYCEEVIALLKAGGVRCKLDDRSNYNPGWKYNHWEQKGVPLRLEVGPRDMAAARVVVVRRDDGSKVDVAREELLTTTLQLLETMQGDLFARAKETRDAHLTQVTTWEAFVPALNRNFMVMTPFCNEEEWEEKVKVMSREQALAGGQEDARTSTSVAAKTLCIPFEQPTKLPDDGTTKCFVSGKPAQCWVMWGRSY